MRNATGILALLAVAGCQAGTSAELLTFDNITAAAVEVKKGVLAYDQAVVGEQVKTSNTLMTALSKDVANIAAGGGMSKEEAAALGERVAAVMRGHLANFAEQERRRQLIFEPTIDNLNYIIQICAQGKQFSIYRSSVSAQWKAYLEATSLSQLRKIDSAAVASPSLTSSLTEALTALKNCPILNAAAPATTAPAANP